MPSPALEIRASAGHPLGMSPARFLREYWQKRPLLIRCAFPDFTPALLPDDLAGLACLDGALARIIVRQRAARRSAARARRVNDGTWKVKSGPFDDATFASLPKSDWTLLVQDVDKWDADTFALLEHFAFIPSWRIDDVMISYAADHGGVGAHIDQYDVFLLQGLGRRRWAIDTHANPSTAFRDDVELKLLREFHPTHVWTLDPGDMLYLPPGVPHDGAAIGECMTWSVGMRAPATEELLFDLAARVAEALPESQRYADATLQPASMSGEIDHAALERVRQALGALASTLDKDAFADWFGSFITRYRSAGAALPRKRSIGSATVARRLPNAVVERNPWSRFAWRSCGRTARLYVGGSTFDAPPGWARALAGASRTLAGARLAKLPQHAHGCALLASLIDAGHLSLNRARTAR